MGWGTERLRIFEHKERNMRWRRRKSLVNVKQQIWFAFELIIVGISFVILCAFLLFVPPFNNVLGTGELAGKVLDNLSRLIFLNWPMIMGAIVAFGMVGVLLSHRLWGPLYQLERVLESWMKGNRRARVHFRRYDYLLPVQNSLNEFFIQQQSILEDVETRAKEIEECLKGGQSDQAAEKVRSLISVTKKKGKAS